MIYILHIFLKSYVKKLNLTSFPIKSSELQLCNKRVLTLEMKKMFRTNMKFLNNATEYSFLSFLFWIFFYDVLYKKTEFRKNKRLCCYIQIF